MSKNYERTYQFLVDADAILEQGYEDQKRVLEEQYNADVDELVEYGNYDYEAGELLKKNHHITLFGVEVTEL